MITQATRINDGLLQIENIGLVIPCWLCEAPVPIKFTKKNKIYLICNNCGIQTFLRYGKAEELLIAKIKEYYESRLDGKGHT